ncbi:hypothetical protein ABH935_009967 [Catenulispora sp. GAS73]
MTYRAKPYPQDLRERAVRLVLETTDQYPSRDACRGPGAG